MNECNSCGTQQEVGWISYSESVKRKRNWEQEFLTKKGINKDNNFQLCSPCQKEIKEFKATEVVKELNQKNLVDADCFPPNYLKASNFTTPGAQKVQRAITENIKRHSREWKIIWAKPLNSEREYYHDWSGDHRNKELEILVHQSAKIEYEEDRFLKWEENKMHLEGHFLSEQWTEIKKALKEVKEHEKEQSKPRKLSPGVILTIIITIGVMISLGLYLIHWKKKKRK